MTQNRTFLLIAAVGCGLVFLPAAVLRAQQTNNAPTLPAATSPSATPEDVDPLKRERTDQEKREARKAVRQEIKGAYKTWLEQDVAYIITDEERRAFKGLGNDEEREAFIEQFWQRRNPDPDSPENTFREEHYRRIAYANEHFAAGKPGWKTDRGHIYINFGQPDEITSHASGGKYDRPVSEGGGETETYPFEVWRYRELEGIGENVELEFVDDCMCGEYRFTIDRGAKDAMAHIANAGLTMAEQMGGGKQYRFDGLESLGLSKQEKNAHESDSFNRMELAEKLFQPPPVKFADLDAFISEHKILTGPIFPFDVRTDYVKVTESAVLVPITVQIKNRDITFETKDGVSKGYVNILGRVATMTHKTVQTFEDTVQVEEPSELLEKALDHQSVYWKALPLMPGLYRLDIAIKDVNNPDHKGYYGRGIEVPSYHDEKLGSSTLILADQMKTVSSHEIGSGNFIIGNTFLRPRVSTPTARNPNPPVTFQRSQQLSFWVQFYNLGIDETSKSNQATVTYQIVKVNPATAAAAATETVVFEKQVDSKDLGSHSDQITVEKSLPMAGLEPGRYKVTVKVIDAISKQELAQSAPFVVE
jgi:GWxTD domain-containing protein